MTKQDYVLGSHNTMSYLRPRRWWMRAVAWVARCQRADYREQWRKGVRLFDLRIGYGSDGVARFRHGLVEYKGADVEEVLRFVAVNGGGVVRLILEESVNDNSEWQEECFREDCRAWAKRYPTIRWMGGRRKRDWAKVVDLAEPTLTQWCGSMQKPWWGKVCPWLWHKLYGDKMPEELGIGYVLKDFI